VAFIEQLGRSPFGLLPVRPRAPADATGDFDIAVVSQLATTNLSFDNPFKPSPIKMVAFHATFGRGRVRE
jgi:hypothetical protein